MRLLIVLLAFTLSACASVSPATKRAAAVALGSLGTGAAVAAQACASQPNDSCQDTAITAGVAVLGTALAAGATAYMTGAEDAPEAPASQPYSPVPAIP
jgi:hypothetical protein